MSGDKRCREQFGSTPRATFIDTFGPEYVDLALELSVDRDRISTIIAFAAAKEHGVKSEGSQPPPDVRHDHRARSRRRTLDDVPAAYTSWPVGTPTEIVLIP
jgi:hypothetical protein